MVQEAVPPMTSRELSSWCSGAQELQGFPHLRPRSPDRRAEVWRCSVSFTEEMEKLNQLIDTMIAAYESVAPRTA